MNSYLAIEQIFRRKFYLQKLGSLASWDRSVMMPEGGNEVRAESLAELESVISDLLMTPHLPENFKKAESEKLSHWQQVNLRLAQREYHEWNAIDPELKKKITLAGQRCEMAWRKLRYENNWKDFLPLFKSVVSLVKEESRQRAAATGLSLYESMLQIYEPGLKLVDVERAFNLLAKELPTLLQEMTSQEKKTKYELGRKVSAAQQKKCVRPLMETFGFNFKYGREDESVHPFCNGTGTDVRVTTRFSETDIFSGLQSVMHEVGHAMYNQNLPSEYYTQPVGHSMGSAIHESQSLFFEMQLGRSPELVQFLTSFLQKHLGEPMDPIDFWTEDNLFRWMAQVEPGLIRVDADEVTYPLHIILRFEIEKLLIEEDFPVEDIPYLWDEKMKKYLGISTIGNDKDGCMQDIHWTMGWFGYFPCYALGAIFASQLMAQIKKEVPDMMSSLRQGFVAPAMQFLNQKIWKHGQYHSLGELLNLAVGEGFNANVFMDHLKNRY